MRLVEHEVKRQSGVIDGVLDRVPDGVGTQVGAGFRQQCARLGLQFLRVVAAYQQAVLAQLLRVEEVDLAGVELRLIKCVLDDDEVRVLQPIG